MILWENVAYLVDDGRRAAAFRQLRDQVGFEPESILAARPETLLQVTSIGIVPEHQAEKLRTAASLALDAAGEMDGGLDSVSRMGMPKAKRLLKRFPGIGDPGAERILLFSGSYPFLTLDSNGLRVLLRFGFGEESSNYSTSYRSVQKQLKEAAGSRSWPARSGLPVATPAWT